MQTETCLQDSGHALPVPADLGFWQGPGLFHADLSACQGLLQLSTFSHQYLSDASCIADWFLGSWVTADSQAPCGPELDAVGCGAWSLAFGFLRNQSTFPKTEEGSTPGLSLLTGSLNPFVTNSPVPTWSFHESETGSDWSGHGSKGTGGGEPLGMPVCPFKRLIPGN